MPAKASCVECRSNEEPAGHLYVCSGAIRQQSHGRQMEWVSRGHPHSNMQRHAAANCCLHTHVDAGASLAAGTGGIGDGRGAHPAAGCAAQ
jgi:hypothetical protein